MFNLVNLTVVFSRLVAFISFECSFFIFLLLNKVIGDLIDSLFRKDVVLISWPQSLLLIFFGLIGAIIILTIMDVACLRIKGAAPSIMGLAGSDMQLGIEVLLKHNLLIAFLVSPICVYYIIPRLLIMGLFKRQKTPKYIRAAIEAVKRNR